MRKAIILAAATIASMAAMTTTANAATVYSVATGEPCPAVSASGNTISGGCLVEDLDGGWGMMNPYTSPPSLVTGCELNFDIRVDSTGTVLYGVNQTNNCGLYYDRVACIDDSTSETLPWPSTVGWSGTDLVYQMDMCFEQPVSGVDAWERVPLTPKDGPYDTFLGFEQNGNSQNGYIAYADFDQLDEASRIATEW